MSQTIRASEGDETGLPDGCDCSGCIRADVRKSIVEMMRAEAKELHAEARRDMKPRGFDYCTGGAEALEEMADRIEGEGK